MHLLMLGVVGEEVFVCLTLTACNRFSTLFLLCQTMCQAAALLNERGVEGAYLVRESESSKGDYSIACRYAYNRTRK